MDKVKLQRSVVTASGYAQDIKDAPASISVVDKEDILTRPIRDIGDAVQDVPGVYVESSKTGGNTITMRGLSSAYTLILIDGKRQNVAQGFADNGFDGVFASFMPPPSMIERIEVIRGPASIIYGSDAMGGVINIITKKHTDKVTAGVQVETQLPQHSDVFGNIYGINGYVTSPIIKNKLSLNLRAGYKTGGQNAFLKPESARDYAYNNAGNDASQGTHTNPYATHSAASFTSWNAGGRLNFTPDSHNTIYLDAEIYNTVGGTLNTSRNGWSAVRNFYKINSVLNHTADYDWGNLTSYIQYSQTMWAPYSVTPGFVGSLPSGAKVNWDGSLHDNKDIVFQSTFKQTYDFSNDSALIFNGGVYYLHENLLRRNVGFQRAMNQFAVFAEGEYLINNYISTTLGLRYNYSDIFNAIPNPRFYVNFNPTEWLTFKAGVATGVLVPQLSALYDGWSLNATGGGGYLGNKNLKPEQSVSYELSAILDFEHSYLTLTGFYTDFNNKISTYIYTDSECQDTTSCYAYRNVDRSMMTGAEFGWTVKPIYGVSLDTSYGFTYTKQLDGTKNPINSIPRHKFVIKPSFKKGDFDAYIRWSGNFQTPTIASSGRNNVRTTVGDFYKDYQLVDIAASYKLLKSYTLTLAVNNIFDVNFEDYIVIGSGATASAQNRYQRILKSRNFWISFKADF
ncbi:ferric enterobactin uptake receptor [Helicobacter sp. MIT 00-7814]|nr:ferric enterobactin uptake receptor [Helicobacter sp. MIT 00-7814]RDU54699.1 ferric enterobactin uptake receptor [Helicobacter sp. MIT 99-10781]